MNSREFLLPRNLLAMGLLLLFAAGAAGCSSSNPTASDAAATEAAGGEPEGWLAEEPGHLTRGYYPLQVGNHWAYQVNSSMIIVPDSCDTACQIGVRLWQGTERRELIGTEERFGREYVVEAQTQRSDLEFTATAPATYYAYYRQDRAGLYEAEVLVNPAPGPIGSWVASDQEDPESLGKKLSAAFEDSGWPLTAVQAAAYETALGEIERKLDVVALAAAWPGHLRRPPGRRGGVLDGELTRLKYPLHPRQRWIIRDDPLFTSHVVRHERLRLPAGRMAGWKVQIHSELFGPGDRVFLWYSRAGFLKLTAALQGIATDEVGNIIGTVYSWDSVELEGFELVRP